MPLIAPLPFNWLIHSVEYIERDKERDEFGNILYKPAVTIGNVRYDEQTSYARGVQENTLEYSGVIFVDARHSTNIPNPFIENSMILFKGKELTLKRVITCYQPNTDLVRHYELEVI